MTESNVAIPPDNVGVGAHNVRTITVQVDNSALIAGGQAEQQQVVSLADSAGKVANLVNGAVPVSNDEMTTLLSALIIRLDLLCAMVDTNYRPPDHLGLN